MRAISLAMSILLVTAGSASAKKPSPRHQCKTARHEALELEGSGRLVEATEALLRCAKATCGAAIAKDCSTRFAKIEAEIPTIVPVAVDAAGTPVVDVRVMVDGAELTSHLDGAALPVNPGLHELAFERAGAAAVIQKVMIVQGQRNRPITASFTEAALKIEEPAKDPTKDPAKDPAKELEPALPEAEPAPPPPPPVVRDRAPIRVVSTAPASNDAMLISAIVVGGTSLLAVTAGSVLTFWGRKDNASLAECSPFCAPGSISHIRRLYIAADISFGVGAAAAAASIWLFASSFTATVEPIPDGAVGTVSGRF